MGDLRQMMQARRAEHTLATLRRQAAQRETRTVDTVVRLPLADITVEERVQVRVAGLDADTVASYATVFAEGGEFPPVVVFRDERNGELYLADGFHRVAAARLAGLTEIAAEVRPGGLAGAVEYAEEANLTHGLNLTMRDKRAILERRLARGHEWANWSNRALAAALGVDEGTVRNWRKALSTAENSAVAPTKRVGADGREYDVRNIQTAAKQRQASPPAPRYVDDPEFDQRVAGDDETASPRPLLPTADLIQQAVLGALAESAGPLTLAQLHNRVEKRLASRVHLPTLSSIVARLVAYSQVVHEPVTDSYSLPQPVQPSPTADEDERFVRRLAERLETAIYDLLRDSHLTLDELRAALRGRGLDAESALGVAALRVALNRLLESGQVVRDGPRYLLVPPDGPHTTAALGMVVGAMEALAAALDNVLELSVADQAVLDDPAVRQALSRLWDLFPPLRQKLTEAEERVEGLLRQSIEGLMGGLG